MNLRRKDSFECPVRPLRDNVRPCDSGELIRCEETISWCPVQPNINDLLSKLNSSPQSRDAGWRVPVDFRLLKRSKGDSQEGWANTNRETATTGHALCVKHPQMNAWLRLTDFKWMPCDRTKKGPGSALGFSRSLWLVLRDCPNKTSMVNTSNATAI